MRPTLSDAFGRTPESWLDFDPTRHRPAEGYAAAATANPLASWAAVSILRQGGTAVDAAIAAQAVLTLVEPNASGLGGGAMVLVHEAGQTTCIDGLSAAPSHVPSRLIRDFDGRPIPADRAMYGGRTAGVPGALRALADAHGRFGRLPWQALFAPAIELATDGFPLSPYLWRTLQEIPAMRDEPFAHALYCGGGDLALMPGTRLRNPALAATLTRIASQGVEELYQGETAAAICRAVAEDAFPGTITLADLGRYRAVTRTPQRFALGDKTVLGGALPSYGSLAAAQIIGIAARFGVTELGESISEQAIHVLAEAGRMCFAERAPFADPDFGTIATAELLDPAYLDARAGLLSARHRMDRLPRGRLADTPGSSMTSHLSIADEDGQVVSMTTTINQNFGARIAVGGFYLNNVMTNFATEAPVDGVAPANAIEPGKRAKTTIAPVLVLNADGSVLASLGAGGGYRIIGYVANALLRLAGGMRDPQAIVGAPHALNWNGITEIETRLRQHERALHERGHWVSLKRMDGGTQCLIRNGRLWQAGGDPRRDGAGMAVLG